MSTPATGELYTPAAARILERTAQTHDTFLLRVAFEDRQVAQRFDYQCGQFAAISVEGVGECPISITSSPRVKDHLEFCVRAVGEVTEEICAMSQGAGIGIRGPFGRPFPVEAFKGQDILVVAGGIGLAPLRPLINSVLQSPEKFGKVDIVYGARSSADLCFRDELSTWRSGKGAGVYVTVDREEEGWRGHVGFVPDYVDELGMRQGTGIVVVCGPPIMITIELDRFEAAGRDAGSVWTTLERKMRCGVGKCARCLVGSKYVCVDGPVFNMEELKNLPWRE